MNNPNKNDDDEKSESGRSENSSNEDDYDKVEAIRIMVILQNQSNFSRRAECGSVIQMEAKVLLEGTKLERLGSKYIYGIISKLEDICDVTHSRAYQINWSVGHLSTGHSDLAFIAPVFEHDFNVLKFPNEEDDYDDEYFTNQFRKVDGSWMIVEYTGPQCEFCEGHTCDRLKYKDELGALLVEASSMGGRNHNKRFMMYGRFTFLKHGQLGSNVRRRICGCVTDLIVSTFPVEAGARRRGFVETNN